MADLEQGLLRPCASPYEQAPFPDATNELVQGEPAGRAAPAFHHAYWADQLHLRGPYQVSAGALPLPLFTQMHFSISDISKFL